jgi:hypothetical protein
MSGGGLQMIKAFGFIALLALTTPALADAVKPVCPAPPAPVKAYLHKTTGWRITDIGDLSPYDRELWQKDYPGACPGMVAFDADGSGSPAFGLLLRKKASGKTLEQLIILRFTDGAYHPYSVHAPKAGSGAISKATSGAYKTTSAGKLPAKSFTLTFEGVTYIHFESAASVTYFEDGKFKEKWISD